MKSMAKSAAIHVECGEDIVNRIDRDVGSDSPEQNVQVFLAGLELIEDRIEEFFAVVEFTLKESEIAAIKFDPELLAL